MTIIHTGDKHSLAAYDRRSGKAVVVALNTAASCRDISVEFDGISIKEKTAKLIRTSGDIKSGEHWAEIDEIPLPQNRLTAKLKENSITTFVIE